MGNNSIQTGTINLLLVDDSLEFRGAFRQMIADSDEITIVGEACNGIEALVLTLKLKPTVIVMDLEMPLMDGMIALQHLMIHVPTPTIMISGLTKEGTARAFDSLKNGAVDFIHKGSFLKNDSSIINKELVLSRVKDACRVVVESTDPVFPAEQVQLNSLTSDTNIEFCEECGFRIMIGQCSINQLQQVVCTNCGEKMDLSRTKKHRRVTFLIVLGAGEGTYANILKIIPQMSSVINGSVIIGMYGNPVHIDLFAQYLDSISLIHVCRFKDGMTLTGGTCYIASVQDNIYMSSHKTDYTLKSGPGGESAGPGPLDVLMTSLSPIFKNRLMGVIFSGSEQDGAEGLNVIQKNGGTAHVLHPQKCMHKQMAKNIVDQYDISLVDDETALSIKIQEMFDTAQKSIVTA